MTEITDAAEGPDTRMALLRHAASVVILVALVSTAFWAIGSLDADDRDVALVAEGDDPSDDADEAEDTTDDAPEADADGTEADAEGTAVVPEAESHAEDTSETSEAEEPDEPATDDVAEEAEEDGEDASAEPDAAGEEAAEEEAADEEAADEEAAEEGTADEALAPGDVTVQVLDGYKSDGGTAARRVAQQLRDRGYRIIAENQALTYPTTVVFWTSGNEIAARQVAREIGAGDVRPQPGTLSEAVAVHVVVGADRG